MYERHGLIFGSMYVHATVLTYQCTNVRCTCVQYNHGMNVRTSRSDTMTYKRASRWQVYTTRVVRVYECHCLTLVYMYDCPMYPCILRYWYVCTTVLCTYVHLNVWTYVRPSWSDTMTYLRISYVPMYTSTHGHMYERPMYLCSLGR